MEEAVYQLFDRYGLVGWGFGFNNDVRRAGVCRFPTGRLPGRIELSSHFVRLNNSQTINEVLLHELAHALAGPDAGHGRLWQEWCHKLGIAPQARYGANVVMPEGKWRAGCRGCQATFNRHRRPSPLTGWKCKCGAAIRWKLNGK